MANIPNDKILRKYIRQTKQLLNCPRDYRRQFVADLQESLAKFIAEDDSVNESGIISYFGTPDELAQTYLDGIPQEELSAYKRKRKLRIIIVFLVLMLSSGITVSYLSYEAYVSNKGKLIYMEETIKTLDEDIE